MSDASYVDSLSKVVNHNPLLDSGYVLLLDQQKMMKELVEEKNKLVEEKNNIMVMQKKQVESKQEEETAENFVDENSEGTENSSEEKKNVVKKVALGAGAVGLATVGAFVANKVICDRLDITIEFLLMSACINSCGYDMMDKCGESIMSWLCKDKESANEIAARVKNSCSIR